MPLALSKTLTADRSHAAIPLPAVKATSFLPFNRPLTEPVARILQPGFTTFRLVFIVTGPNPGFPSIETTASANTFAADPKPNTKARCRSS